MLRLLLFLSLTVALFAGPAKHKAAGKVTPRTSAGSSAHRTGSAHKSADAGRKSSLHSVSRWRGSRRSTSHQFTPSQPARQAVPSSDRFKEIQDALAAKGYLKTPPTGTWDKESSEALSRFQADQNLQATGKLSSRALIALGLGPKDGQAGAAAPAPAPSQQPPQP